MHHSKLMILTTVSVAFLIIFSYFFIAQQNEPVAITDEQYLPALFSELSSAKSSIRVIMFESRYYNQSNSSANQILQKLADAKARGVDVRVILEGGEAFLGDAFGEAQQRACNFLSSQNVPVKFDPKKITTHAKLVIIDDHKVLIGSTNWNYNALEKNHETSALVDSASMASDFENYFEGLWEDSMECANKTL